MLGLWSLGGDGSTGNDTSESLGVKGNDSELAELGRSALGRTGIVRGIGILERDSVSESLGKEGEVGVVAGVLRRT